MTAEKSSSEPSANGTRRGIQHVKSLSRSTLILRTLADRPMRPIDLSRELSTPWATIYRTVRGLTEDGLLQRDPDTGEYSIGPTLFALATTYLRDHVVLGVGLGHLEQALQHVDGLLKVTERCGTEAITLFAEQNPQRPAVRRIREQYRLPLHCVSFGQVLLANEDDEFIEAYLAQPLRRVGERTITEPVRLREVLEQVRQQGYAVSRAELQGNNASISVPVMRKDGKVVASLTAVVPLHLFEQDDVKERHHRLLVDTAMMLSESLGWRVYHDTGFYERIT